MVGSLIPKSFIKLTKLLEKKASLEKTNTILRYFSKNFILTKCFKSLFKVFSLYFNTY